MEIQPLWSQASPFTYTTYYDVQHFEAVCREPCEVAHAGTHSINSHGAGGNARAYVCKYVYVSEKGAFLPIKGASSVFESDYKSVRLSICPPACLSTLVQVSKKEGNSITIKYPSPSSIRKAFGFMHAAREEAASPAAAAAPNPLPAQQHHFHEQHHQQQRRHKFLHRGAINGSSSSSSLPLGLHLGCRPDLDASFTFLSALPSPAPQIQPPSPTTTSPTTSPTPFPFPPTSPLCARLFKRAVPRSEYLQQAHLLSFWLLHPHDFPWAHADAAGDACVTFKGSKSPCAAAGEVGSDEEQGEEIKREGEGVGEGEGGSTAAAARVMVSGGEGGGEMMIGVESGVGGEAGESGEGGEAAVDAFASVDEAAEALTQLKPCRAVPHAHPAAATAAADDDDVNADADGDADGDADADADCAVVETRSEDANGDATIEAEAEGAEATAEAEAEEDAVDIRAWPKRRRGGGGSRSRSKKARVVVVTVGRAGSGNDASSLPSSASSGEDVEEEEAAVAVSRARGNGEGKEKDTSRNGKKDAYLLKLPKDMQGRWSKERYRTAQVKLVDIMRAQGARPGKPMLRPVLREEARRYIGDTGLLDHLLKHMTDTVVPSGQRFRRRHNSEGAMEYWLEDAGLMAIRAAAGISDPTWVPPPGWKPGADPHLPCGTKRCHKVERDVERMGGSMSAMRKELEELRRQVGKLSSKGLQHQEEQQQQLNHCVKTTNGSIWEPNHSALQNLLTNVWEELKQHNKLNQQILLALNTSNSDVLDAITCQAAKSLPAILAAAAGSLLSLPHSDLHSPNAQQQQQQHDVQGNTRSTNTLPALILPSVSTALPVQEQPSSAPRHVNGSEKQQNDLQLMTSATADNPPLSRLLP
ncbi:unnamed protein product [Closterium sp. Yama58-4]|nr:unnamed protein product [Closterium sp. Yama58-4]